MSKEPTPRMDPAWIRGMTQRRMSRRDLFRYAGAGAGALGLSSILAACGVSGEAQTTGPTAGAEGSAEWWADMKTQGPGDHLNFTNWPAYIDRDFSIDGPGSRPSLYAFTQATGIDVTYRADINDNADFYATIRPALESGQDTGHDIIVMSNFQELTEMIALGYLIELDPELRPNFDANVGPNFKDPAYDPGNKYTMAWQSGATGIGWNTKYVDEPITSLDDLLNPKYAGHVAMFNNAADSARAGHAPARHHAGDLDARGLAEGGRLPPAVQRRERTAAWLDGPGVPDGDRERGPVGHDGVVGRHPQRQALLPGVRDLRVRRPRRRGR